MALSTRQALFLALTVLFSGVLLYRIEPYLHVYKVEKGDRAPGFALIDENGDGVSLEDYEGKYVLLNFWASWCPPCVQETPSLNALHKELAPEGFVVLGVSVDAKEQAYSDFLDRFQIAFPTVRDPEMGVATRYGTTKYPESYLIGPDGYVVRRYIGAENWMRPEVVNYIRSLL